MTLAEVMISVGLFAVVASALLSGLLFTRRLSKNSLAQSHAHSTVQSVVEQIVCNAPQLLANATETGIEIKMPVPTTPRCRRSSSPGPLTATPIRRSSPPRMASRTRLNLRPARHEHFSQGRTATPDRAIILNLRL
jgi:type II secretory pathway pseudopilin PulG